MERKGKGRRLHRQKTWLSLYAVGCHSIDICKYIKYVNTILNSAKNGAHVSNVKRSIIVHTHQRFAQSPERGKRYIKLYESISS